MSAIGSMLGVNGGAGGTGFSSPSGTNQGQLDTAYNNTQNAISTQNNFISALAGLNGTGNQSQVYSQLADIAAGRGPNPAATMLNQATGANVAQTAALMAGQRGSSANVGLIARSAARQGAETQQQAVGQGATMQANQSLNAITGMGNIANTEVGNQAGAIGQEANTSLGQQGNLLGLQGNINNANAGMATGRITQGGNLIGNLTGAIGAGATLLAAKGGQIPRVKMAEGGPPQAGAYAPMPAVSPFAAPAPAAPLMAPMVAPTAPSSAPMPPDPSNSSMHGPQSGVGKYFMDTNSGQNTFANGWNAVMKAFGGNKSPGNSSTYNTSNDTQEQQYLDADAALGTHPGTGIGPATQAEASAGIDQEMPAVADAMPMAARGGKISRKVPALVSPGEVYLKPNEVNQVAKGKKDPIKAGEKIPGKPRVAGAVNSYSNDTVPKKLDEGGIVIPRSITEGPNPHWAAMKFVHATLAKNKKLPPRK